MSFDNLAPLMLCIGLALIVLPSARRENPLVRAVAAAITMALVLRYLVWRVAHTLPPFDLTGASLWAWGFMLLEVAAGLSGLTVLFFLSRHRDRREEADRNAPWVAANRPRVALLIPTYNEEREILERTIAGAMAQDYDNLSVYILDDGRRPWLASLCAERGVGYHCRADNAHAKAGNMNAGIAAIEASGERPEIIAILDADFVAMPQFVRRALALMHDPAVGVVQTPQFFFNDDPFQHAFRGSEFYPDEQRFFFDTILQAKDAWGVAFSCGTSSLVRRSALAEIGGFPTESVTEDMLLSLKLKAAGWKTVYLAERLTQGLAPEGMAEYTTQRARWCLGLMQILRSKWGPLSRNGLGLIDRLGTIDSALYWITTFPFRIMCFLVPVTFWFTGASVVHTTLGELVSHIGPAVAAQVILLGWLSRGRILPVMTDANQLMAAPAAIGATLTGLLRPRGHKFVVTAKGGDRSRVVVQWGLLARIGLLIGLTLAGVAYAYLDPSMPYHHSDAFVVSLFWSYYNIFVLLIAGVVCIEQPRHREERFLTGEEADIRLPGGLVKGRLRELSLEGATVAGAPPAPVGTRAILHLSGAAPLAVRIEPSGGLSGPRTWEARFEDPQAARPVMIGRLFSGAYRQPPLDIRFLHIFGAMMRRLAT